MRIPSTASIPLLVLAAALTAGCSGMRSDSGSTTAMGAGPARQVVMCRDAAWVANASECSNHGGVERAMSQEK